MASLPLLPGYQPYSYSPDKSYPRKQTLDWKKGVPISDKMSVLGLSPLPNQQTDELRRKELCLQFGSRRHLETPSRFLPKWAILEKKVLQFSGYFTETWNGSGDTYRIRPIVFRYYLLDDTIAITEPKQANSGLPQGALLKRQQIPRSNSEGKSMTLEEENHEGPRFWHWSDLNTGTEIEVYGRKYFLCDCDEFTKEFLLSEGIKLNPPAEIPLDPYEALRLLRKENPRRSASLRPKSSRERTMNSNTKGNVLKFDIMVEEAEDMKGKRSRATSAVLSYRLEDGKIEIRKPSNFEDIEIKRFSPVVLKWVKVPIAQNFKTGAADIGEEDEDLCTNEYLTPKHLIPPSSIKIFGRKALVTGCDSAAQNFIKDLYGIENLPEMIKPERENLTEYGSSGKVHSDIVTKPITKPGIWEGLESKVLRFLAKLVSRSRDDEKRSFVISFFTIDSTFEIFEKSCPGGLGGRILSRIRIPKEEIKTDSLTNNYYGLEDIGIGSEINVWGKKYKFVGADKYVLNYAEENPEKITPHLLTSLREYFSEEEEQK